MLYLALSILVSSFASATPTEILQAPEPIRQEYDLHHDKLEELLNKQKHRSRAALSAACARVGESVNNTYFKRERDYAADMLQCLSDTALAEHLGATALALTRKANLTNEESACVARYETLQAKGKLRIGIYYGYGDPDPGGNFNFGPYTRDIQLATLTSPCPKASGLQACGFRVARVEKNPVGSGASYLLTKTIPGLRGDVPVQIYLKAAPLSADESFNRANAAQQKKMSAETRAAFLQALSRGDEVVVYAGHSRDGGGPDFTEGKKLANGHIDYPWYRKNKPGLKALLSALREGNQHPAVYASFSCNSYMFAPSLRATTPDSMLALSTESAYVDPDNIGMLAFLDSLLGSRCGKDMNQLMNHSMRAYEAVLGEREIYYRLYGLTDF